MEHCFTIAAWEREHEKFPGYKFTLVNRDWNDFGYYTLHELFLILPDKPYNIKLADIRLFNQGQTKGAHANLDSNNFVGFISNIDSAEKMLLLLTPEERNELLSALHINFSGALYKCEQALLKSVLRGITFEDFEKLQVAIKRIVTSTLDVASMLQKNLQLVELI